jgi:hypothetical protein
MVRFQGIIEMCQHFLPPCKKGIPLVRKIPN